MVYWMLRHGSIFWLSGFFVGCDTRSQLGHPQHTLCPTAKTVPKCGWIGADQPTTISIRDDAVLGR